MKITFVQRPKHTDWLIHYLLFRFLKNDTYTHVYNRISLLSSLYRKNGAQLGTLIRSGANNFHLSYVFVCNIVLNYYMLKIQLVDNIHSPKSPVLVLYPSFVLEFNGFNRFFKDTLVQTVRRKM